MVSANRIRVLVILGLVFLVAASVSSRPRRMQRLQAGSWGGPHIRIEVGADSATIDYDCANGSITGPLLIDSKGRFTWRGTHNREHPGPIRDDEAGNSEAAIYAGRVRGNTMTLTVRLSNSHEPLDSFTLTRGSQGRVFKCK